MVIFNSYVKLPEGSYCNECLSFGTQVDLLTVAASARAILTPESLALSGVQISSSQL